MKTIKEITEFAKLFKLNIPVNEHFEYYIQTLSHSFEFRDIVALVNNYSDFEDWLKENGYNNVGHYKMGYVYELILNHLKSSQAYLKCQEFDYSTFKFYERDLLKIHEGNFMLSLDISSANFQAMKIFDQDNELKSSWKELCDSLKIHPVISSSKSFRQVLFGNLNPKRFQKIQHRNMIMLAEELEKAFSMEEVISISHDEIIMNLGEDQKDAHQKANMILKAVESIRAQRLEKCEPWMGLGSKIFTINKIAKGIYVKTIFFLVEDSIVESYKTLFGCPGNMFYMYFKKHILGKEVEERDCLFSIENRLAKWII